MKVKLFTHNDLDGVGCAIVAYSVFGKSVVDVEYCNYDDINEKVKKFLFSDKVYICDHVFITDLSINEEVANYIQASLDVKDIERIRLIDHHKTAEYLNKYDWATVLVEDENGKQSGTSLFHQYLLQNGYCVTANTINKLHGFSEIVRKYDTWEWKTKYDDLVPKQFNDLLYILGKDMFIEEMYNRVNLYNSDIGLTVNDLTLLELRQIEIDKYIKTKNKHMIKAPIDGYDAGIVFAERFTSELGDRLCELNPDIDFVAIINPSYAVSYRTIKDIDVSEVAKLYGGGGHVKASGSPINEEQKDWIIKFLFG